MNTDTLKVVSLGIYIFGRKLVFIPDLAKKRNILQKLIRKSNRLGWTEEHTQCMDELLIQKFLEKQKLKDIDLYKTEDKSEETNSEIKEDIFSLSPVIPI